MVCEGCRSQARGLVRSAMRATPTSSAARMMPVARTALRAAITASAPSATASRRAFTTSTSRNLLGASFRDSYRVLGVSERLFKVCAKQADYRITEEKRKKDEVSKLEDGEELGESLVPDSVWHKTFNLPPTFSTWSHVTMLHLYLLNARVRCFDRDEFRNWSQQLVDHFFFECEKKMHVDHHITSSALRQRYLKDIFVQWRGLLLAYDEGLVKGDAVLASAVWRNLFKGDPDVDPRALVAVVGWMRSSLASLEGTSDMAFPQAAGEILEKPVDVFWTRLEEPFKKHGATEPANPAQAAAKAAAEKRA